MSSRGIPVVKHEFSDERCNELGIPRGEVIFTKPDLWGIWEHVHFVGRREDIDSLLASISKGSPCERALDGIPKATTGTL